MLNPFRAVGKHSDKASSAATRPTPGSFPNTADSLYDLADSCKERYQQTGDLTPLNEAITHYQAALKQTPAPSVDRAGSLNQELAIVLYMRYREMHHLEASIACDQEAVKLFPPSHPKRSISFYDLGVALFTRFEETGGLQYLEESITYHRDALELRPASHPDRYVSLNNLANALFTRFQRTRLLTWTDALPMLVRPWS